MIQLVSLFHHLLKGGDELFDDLIIAFAYVIPDAGADVVGQEHLAETVESRVYCRCLDEDVRAVCAFFDHGLDAADLSLYAAQPVDQILVLFRTAFFSLLAARAAFFFLCHEYDSVSASSVTGIPEKNRAGGYTLDAA